MLRDAEWSTEAGQAQLDATHGPNGDLGSSGSGGMALTILGLVEHTLLMNTCCSTMPFII